VHLLVCDNKWIFKMHGATIKICNQTNFRLSRLHCRFRLIIFLMIDNDVHGGAKFSENVTDLRNFPHNWIIGFVEVCKESVHWPILFSLLPMYLPNAEYTISMWPIPHWLYPTVSSICGFKLCLNLDKVLIAVNEDRYTVMIRKIRGVSGKQRYKSLKHVQHF
jgi:hypothetical protein